MAGLSDGLAPPEDRSVSAPLTRTRSAASRRVSVPLTLAWVAQHVTHVHSSSKFAGLQIRLPKLSTEEAVKPLTPIEGVQYILLGVSHGRIAEQLGKTADISNSFIALLTIWGFFMAGIDYGARFGDGDLYHRILWSVHTLALYGVMMDVDALAATGDTPPGLMVSLAFGYLVLATSGLGRAAWHLQAAKRYCLFNGSCHVFRAILYLACLEPSSFEWRDMFLWTATMLYMIEAPISRLMFRLSVPANVTYTVHKVTGLWSGALGSLLVKMAISYERLTLTSSYVTVILGFTLFLLIKIFLIDTDEVMPQDHALRRSGILPGYVWLCICPLCTAGLLGMASGFHQLLECTLPDITTDEADDLWAKQLMNSSLGVLVSASAVQRWLHRSIVQGDSVRQMLVQTLISVAAFLLNLWKTLPALTDALVLAGLTLLAVMSGYWDNIRYMSAQSQVAVHCQHAAGM